MTLRLQLPRPVVGAATRFHAYQARRKLREIPQYLLAPESLLNNRFATLIDPVHLEYGFSQIDANCSNLHLGRLSQFVGTLIRHFGTWMPV